MIQKALICVLGCAVVVVLSGCYTARTYVVNKERVDQEIPGQPANTPVKTRKVFVFELIEKNKAAPVLASDEVQAPAAAALSSAAREDDFTLPQSSAPVEKPFVEAPSVVTDEPQMYVVEKDDTLQKISKKVYGVYSQWPRIYDANRAVIKDPNFLKPGVTLMIPAPAIPTTDNK